jgi:ankyrin repeat protein
VRETLKSLPKTLDATYDRILASIPDETADIALSALMLLAYSARPMTLQEIAEAMVVDHQSRTFNPDEDRLTNCREVLEICGSLVTVVTRENHLPSWVQTIRRPMETTLKPGSWPEIVQFAHFTVKEYIVLERSRSNAKLERFSFSASQAHRTITTMSLVYLLTLGGGQRLDKIDFDRFPFLAYSTQYWTEHWRRQLDDKEDQGGVNSLIRRLFDTEQDPNGYINFMNMGGPDRMVVDDKNPHEFNIFRIQAEKSLDALPQPLYSAAGLGDSELCQWLIVDKGCDVNSRRGRFGHAIQIAARFGHDKVVSLLLDHGASVNTLAGEYGYPLQAAAFGGHVESLGILLERGADVNAYGGNHGTALIAACSRGHIAAVRLLLDNGADVDPVCEYKGTAMRLAAKTGNKGVVQLLLDKGGKLNEGRRGSGGSPLCAAASEGHVDLVKFLVAAGADINLWCEGKGTALMAACRVMGRKQGAEGDRMARHLEILRYLLQCGADPNMHDEICGDALQAAVVATGGGNVTHDNIDLVTPLLEAGADINHTGGIHHSAIRAAVSCGNIPAAQALLDRDVMVDDEVFLLAVEHESETIIPRLLAQGVEVNAENATGSALSFAISKEDQATINALLSDSAIDINALTGRGGRTALYHAVSRGNLALARRLLELGADAGAPCGNGDMCLIQAAELGDIAMIELLLKSGADINAGSQANCKTPLTAACERAGEVLISFLLDQGADINARAPRGGPGRPTPYIHLTTPHSPCCLAVR